MSASQNDKLLYPVTAGDRNTSLSARFENPIVKVSIRSGVICNRIEKFWTEQAIKIKECAS